MFDSDYKVYGKHAVYMNKLAESKVFERYIDVLMTAASIGALYNKRAHKDSSTSEKSSIFAETILLERIKLLMIFRTIILTDNSKPWTFEQRADICFRYSNSKTDSQTAQSSTEDSQEEKSLMLEAKQLFDSYVLGGIEFLYNMICNHSTVDLDDTVGYVFDALKKQQEVIEKNSLESEEDLLFKAQY